MCARVCGTVTDGQTDKEKEAIVTTIIIGVPLPRLKTLYLELLFRSITVPYIPVPSRYGCTSAVGLAYHNKWSGYTRNRGVETPQKIGPRHYPRASSVSENGAFGSGGRRGRRVHSRPELWWLLD